MSAQEAKWRERKLPSGDTVDVTRIDGVGYVAQAGLNTVRPFLGNLKADEVGARYAFSIPRLRDVVTEAVKIEFGDASNDRAKALRKAVFDVSKLVELTTPKDAARRTPPSGLLFELPPQDPAALARKEAKKDEARRVRMEQARDRKALAEGKRLASALATSRSTKGKR